MTASSRNGGFAKSARRDASPQNS